ncbi:MAG: hypothetical protein QXK39_05830 [Nitrososphaerota archaeon]
MFLGQRAAFPAIFYGLLRLGVRVSIFLVDDGEKPLGMDMGCLRKAYFS